MLESPSLIRPRFAAILGASLSLGAIGSAQDPAGVDEGTAVEMEVPLGVQCGLGQGFHAGRRAALSERLEQGVIVMKGLDGPRSLARFNQDKLFWYLTGVSAPGAWLVQPIGGEPILFLPRPDRGKESWNGELWDTEDPWAEYVTGIQDIREVSELESSLRELREDHDRFWTSLHPAVALTDSYDTAGPFDRARVNAPWDGVMPREYRIKKWLEDTFEVEVGDLAKDVTLLRW